MRRALTIAVLAIELLLLSGCAGFVSDIKDPDPGPPDPTHFPGYPSGSVSR
jgi:hypothetical protein